MKDQRAEDEDQRRSDPKLVDGCKPPSGVISTSPLLPQHDASESIRQLVARDFAPKDEHNLKDRVAEAIHLESGVRNKNMYIIELLVDLRTDMLITDLKLLSAQAKLQRLLDELDTLTQPNGLGMYIGISPKQITALIAKYHEQIN